MKKLKIYWITLIYIYHAIKGYRLTDNLPTDLKPLSLLSTLKCLGKLWKKKNKVITVIFSMLIRFEKCCAQHVLVRHNSRSEINLLVRWSDLGFWATVSSWFLIFRLLFTHISLSISIDAEICMQLNENNEKISSIKIFKKLAITFFW